MKISSLIALFINKVSAPNISGTSVSTVVAPLPIAKSDNSPIKGLAVMPESHQNHHILDQCVVY